MERLPLALMLLTLAPAAYAHAPGVSSARLAPDAVVLTFSLAELESHLDLSGLDTRGTLQRAIADRAALSRGGQPCSLGPATARRVEPGGLELTLPATCPADGDQRLEAGYLAAFNPEHRHLVSAPGDPGVVVTPAEPVAELVRASAAQVLGRFFTMGVQHILGGADHLVFLLGLVVATRGLRSTAAVATGFTVGHSATLIVSALAGASLSPAWVEPAIALSLVFVGIENFWTPPLRRRLWVTLGLGALHGLGFAGALAEVGVPPDARIPALLSFNVGVEAGQLGVLALVLPVLAALRDRAAWDPWGPRLVSAGVAVAGLSWFTVRFPWP